MCGIAGELSLGARIEPGAIEAMRDALQHRGPDDQGLYCDAHIGLGHRRLSIIDLSACGRNPLWTTDRSLAIVFNGEVYNHAEVRRELEAEGYAFATATDTEVVLNAVHRWGMSGGLQRLIGMFAFAVWNAAEQVLFLARDRVGVKPLFYARLHDRLLFGSEVRALYAHPAYEKRLDPRGLAQYFVLGYTLGDTTPLANTWRVPAGHFLRADTAGTIRLEKYWDIDGIARGSFPGTFEDAAAELERLSESAFAYRLVSDVPVGVFLSGGIDSTFLAAILRKKLGADLLHLTIGFGEARYDETPLATSIAAQLGVRHHVEYFRSIDAEAALRGFPEIYDEPFGDTSGLPTAILSKLARKHVKVALSADGGDEQFCGYESSPLYARRNRQLQRVPAPLRAMLASLLSSIPYRPLLSAAAGNAGSGRNLRLISTVEKGFELLRASAPSDVIRVMNEKGWATREVGALLGQATEDIFADGVFASRVLAHAAAGDAAMIDQMMRADYQAFMRDDVLTKVDRASMAVGLECREPFLDHRLAEFAFSLPVEYHYRNGEHKRLLKHVLRQWISDDIMSAPKRGFVIPLYEWMRGPWRPLVREYLSPERVKAVGVLDPAVVAAEVDHFYRYNGVGAERILLLLNFQMWAERWYAS